ncbi:FtsX-like permease family protein [Dechloromonas sp. ZY10]|uniref:ABC transporter permease n=1 Tax=Dechloromonas aquae TaxID=2664436 RepID=UPI0035294CAB
MLRLAWRFFCRELRGRELRLLLLALALAVAATTAVGLLDQRVRHALATEGSRLLGADLLLVGDQAWSAEYHAAVASHGLRSATTQIFPSMVLAGDRSQLAEIKAVSAAYPLRGELTVAGQPAGAPPAGSVWLDERLAAALQVVAGNQIQVGRLALRVGGVLTGEPDRGFGFFSLAPRLMLAQEDLAATGLTGFGARIRHRLLVAGEASAVAAFAAWAKPRLGRGQRLESLDNARPEMRSALDRIERFLGLAAMLTVVLAAVAVALAARRYTQRHLDACALLRCLGLTQQQLLSLHALQFLVVVGAASGLGVLLGYLGYRLLLDGVGQALALALPPLPDLLWQLPSVLLKGGLLAAVLLFGFAWPPLVQLARVPSLRVLRRELGSLSHATWFSVLVGALALAGLVLYFAGDLRLGGLVLGGFTLAVALFWLLAQAGIALAAGLRGAAGVLLGAAGWRQGLANLVRHRHSNSVQIVALALGMMALLLLSVTSLQLLQAWQQATPADAPNHFLINIQPEQRGAVQAALAKQGVVAELAPMVRARLLQIAGRPVSAAAYPDDERAQRLVEREFNLSWRAELPTGNRITAGRWFAPADVGQPVASVEAGLAQTLGIKLGDELCFSIDGQDRCFRVVALRQLAWDSLRVNFFVLTPPGVLESAPASDITSFHLQPQQFATVNALLAEFPNLTLIDVEAMLGQFERLMTQLAVTIRVVFIFALLAGVLVLHAALLAAFAERQQELALLRALGATRRQLRLALLVELAAVGGLAGTLAGGAASLLGMLVAEQVLRIAGGGSWFLVPLAALAGMLLTLLSAAGSIRHLLRTPPGRVLREMV